MPCIELFELAFKQRLNWFVELNQKINGFCGFREQHAIYKTNIASSNNIRESQQIRNQIQYE